MINQPPITSPVDISGFLTLTQASKRIPRMNGHRVHPSTAFRWTKKGVGGIFLEHWRIGRKIVTTEDALHKFFTDLAKADLARTSQTQVQSPKRKRRPRPAERQAAIDEANAVLVRAGIIKPTQITFNQTGGL